MTNEVCPKGSLMEPLLEMKDIYQAYGKNLVIRNLFLTLKKGQIGCLLGPSGCGKTSVLRTIAGFEKILSGEIMLAAIPFTRLSHMLLYVFNRGYIASEFGAVRKVQDW